ncbi:MAG: argininosuccinate lyase, partial [Bdellovibrionota bacterium]
MPSRTKRKAPKRPAKLWGGRFSAPTDPAVEAFTESVSFDRRLAPFDLRGSIAHARMLGKIGLLPKGDAKKIVSGLEAILREVEAGKFQFDPALEDVHTNIEAALTRRIGPAGGRLHTARSRNDQVSTAVRLYLRDRVDALSEALARLVRTLAAVAAKETETILPGYTHLQRAQPVSLAHHLLAWAQMFLRDLDRLLDARRRLNVLPLGSGALAGSSFKLDRAFVARQLGFDSVTENSLDAVSDRDFIAEFLSIAALSGIHLSRVCEDLVLWSTAEFGFIKMSDAFTTGSSLMPQKRNPDVAELIRGKSGRLVGALVSLLTLLKGLPLSYNRDLQEDKEPLFDAVDTWLASVELLEKMVRACSFDRKKMAKAASDGGLLATELADYLVRKGLPFRQAHEVVGHVVSASERKGRSLVDFTASELQAFSPLLDAGARQVLDARRAVLSRTLAGGPAPEAVRRQIKNLERALAA